MSDAATSADVDVPDIAIEAIEIEEGGKGGGGTPSLGGEQLQPRNLRHARLAVSMLFITNSLSNAWLPRLAELQEKIQLNDEQLGMVLACGSVGGVCGGPIADYLIKKMGSARAAVGSGLLTALVLPFIGLLPNGIAFGLLLFYLGATDGIQDACMNAHGIRVQSLYGESILNSFHGFWSLGMIFGGLIGVASAAAGVSVAVMMLGISILCTTCVITSSFHLLRGPDPKSYEGKEGEEEQKEAKQDTIADGGACAALKNPLMMGLGLFIIIAVIIELIPMQWSSIYMKSLKVDRAREGIAYVVFNAGMTSGRFLGDQLVDRFSHATWTRISMITTTAAMTTALVLETPVMFTIACGITGLCTATLFPSALHCSAYIPGVNPGTAISITSWLSRAGFAVCPLAVGVLAEKWGILFGVAMLPVAATFAVLVSPVLRSHKATPSDQSPQR